MRIGGFDDKIENFGTTTTTEGEKQNLKLIWKK